MEHDISFSLRIHHTALFTRDFSISIPWWEKMFGLELVYQKAHDLPRGRVNMAWLKGPNLYLELFEHPDDCVAQPEEAYWGYWGCKHICFATEDEDYDKLVDHLRRNGAEFILERKWEYPDTPKPNGCRMAFIRDPDGNRVEIQENLTPEFYSETSD